MELLTYAKICPGRRDKHLMIRLFLLTIGLMLFAACGGRPTPTTAPTATVTTPTSAPALPSPTPEPTLDPNKPVSGGEIVVGTLREPITLNPLLASSPIETMLGALSIEGLVEVDVEGKYTPVLAEELPIVSDDSLVVAYKLKKNVKFSNGDSFTCEDVQFTYEAILSDLSRADTSGYEDIEAVECQGDHIVLVSFSRVYAPYLRLFSHIIPQAAGELEDMDSWQFNRAPIGTGPWIVKEWDADGSILYEKNPYYREKEEPYLESLTIQILPNRQAGLQLLSSGKLDALWGLTEADLPPLVALKGEGDVKYAVSTSGANLSLVLNLANPAIDAPADPARNPHPILGDPAVRQALQKGIDKRFMADILLYGKVRLGESVLPDGPFACPQKPGRYDPEGAKELLDEAGWRPRADGIRVKGRNRLSLRVQIVAEDKLHEDTGQVLVEMLKAIGVELEIEKLPSDEFLADWEAGGSRPHGRFDILMYVSGPGIDPADHLFSNYHSTNIPSAENEGVGDNYSRYINADVDEWIDEAASTTDVEERQALYCKVAEQIMQDLPRIFLYEGLRISGYRAHLRNFDISPGPIGFAASSAGWWFKPAVTPTRTPAPTPTSAPQTLTPTPAATPEPAVSPPTRFPALPLIIGISLILVVIIIAVALLRRRRAPEAIQDNDDSAD